jgi:hypothetical protein
MIHIKTYKIFEKTSLINIGVPYSVMKSMQKNYEISSDAEWKLLKVKKDIIKYLTEPTNNLIVSICKNNIFVSFSYESEYYIETFKLIEKDDFGNEDWGKVDRVKTTISDILSKIKRGCKSYVIVSGGWLPEYSSERKLKKSEIEFDEVTNQFKRDFAENFTRIVKNMYGKKANIVSDIIVNHLKNVQSNISDKEIREILFLNVERAKNVDEFKQKSKDKDPYKLYNEIIMNNSLTIFDEYIVTFEDEMSDKYKEYLNIPIMIENYTRDKVFTAFLYYLYCKKLMKL